MFVFASLAIMPTVPRCIQNIVEVDEFHRLRDNSPTVVAKYLLHIPESQRGEVLNRILHYRPRWMLLVVKAYNRELKNHRRISSVFVRRQIEYYNDRWRRERGVRVLRPAIRYGALAADARGTLHLPVHHNRETCVGLPRVPR